MSVVYDGAGASGRDVVVGFVLSDAGIQFSVGGRRQANYEVEGELHWDDHAQIENMAVCINRVGDDVALIGFDNIQSKLAIPFGLTTISMHKAALTQAVLRLLLRRISGDWENYPERVMFLMHFVNRKSA